MALRPAGLLAAALAATFACDGGLEPEPICAPGLVGVCGVIRFRGTIPESTDKLFVAAYATFPQTCNDLIFNRQPLLPGSVPYTDSLVPYSVPLPPGGYEWVLAVWKKLGDLHGDARDTTLLRVAGYYRDPEDTTRPGAVLVPSGGVVGDVDFGVNFDSLRPATDFVRCTEP
jgi:hypothetical protein